MSPVHACKQKQCYTSGLFSKATQQGEREEGLAEGSCHCLLLLTVSLNRQGSLAWQSLLTLCSLCLHITTDTKLLHAQLRECTCIIWYRNMLTVLNTHSCVMWSMYKSVQLMCLEGKICNTVINGTVNEMCSSSFYFCKCKSVNYTLRRNNI